MANPTQTEIQTQIKNSVKPLDLVRKTAEVTATTLATAIDTAIQALEGDYSVEALDALEQFRSRYASLMTSGAVVSLLAPHLKNYAILNGWPETDPDSLMGRLYDYFIANSLTVKSRDITFGSISAGGSNVGTGTINRLTVDENALKIEATTVEVKTFECVLDANSRSSEGEEVFEVRGKAASKDGLETLGSGLSAEMRAVSCRDSSSFITNPSFETYTGTAAVPTDIQGWTVSDLTKCEIDTTGTTTTAYRQMPGSTTMYSLKLDGVTTLTQELSVRDTKLSPGVPYYLQIAYNREVGSGSMTIQIELGNTTKSVVLAAQTGWNILRLDIGSGSWFKNFNKQDLAVVVKCTAYTSGYVLLDDIVFVPMTQVDGCYYTIVGTQTPFLRRDIFTFTDTGGTSAILQYWFWRGTGHYLPHTTGGTETFADPT